MKSKIIIHNNQKIKITLLNKKPAAGDIMLAMDDFNKMDKNGMVDVPPADYYADWDTIFILDCSININKNPNIIKYLQPEYAPIKIQYLLDNNTLENLIKNQLNNA